VLQKHLGVRHRFARLPVLPVFKWLADAGGIAEWIAATSIADRLIAM